MAMASASELPSFITDLASGSFTPDADLTSLQINHNLGTAPKVVFVYRLDADIESSSTFTSPIVCFYIECINGSSGAWIKNSITYFQRANAAANIGMQNNITVGVRNITNQTFDLVGTTGNPFKADLTYYWLAWY